MQFCPICGNVTKGATKCDNCGYDKELDKVVESPKPQVIEPFLTYIELDELKRRKLDCGELLSISHTSSGGMEGEYHSKRIDFINNKVETVNQDWHHAPRIRREYDVPSEKIEEIKKIIIDNNLVAWSEIKVDRSMIAMDAPTGSTSLSFENVNVSIDDNIYETEEERAIDRDLFTKFNALIDDKYLTNEETEGAEQNPITGMMGNDDCKKLQEDLKNSKFCPDCGTKVEIGPKFCPNCGCRLVGN